MTSIKGYLRLLKDKEYQTPEQLENFIEVAFSKTEMLENLIEDLFEYTRLAGQETKLEYQRLCLNDIVNQVLTVQNIMSNSTDGNAKLIGELREKKYSKGFSCPHCGGTHVVRYGKFKGRQRYKCKDCIKTFSDPLFGRMEVLFNVRSSEGFRPLQHQVY